MSLYYSQSQRDLSELIFLTNFLTQAEQYIQQQNRVSIQRQMMRTRTYDPQYQLRTQLPTQAAQQPIRQEYERMDQQIPEPINQVDQIDLLDELFDDEQLFLKPR